MKNLVQTTDNRVNVMVQCEHGTTRHYSHYDFEVQDVKVLSVEELLKEFEKLSIEEKVAAIKQALKYKEGFAISNVKGGDIDYNDLISYKKVL